MKQVKMTIYRVFVVLAVFAVTLTSCKEEEEVFPAPSVSSSGTLAGIIGATVQVKATINAPAGIKAITVLKNGAAFDSKVLSGEKTYEYIKDYVIDGTANSTVNFTIR